MGHTDYLTASLNFMAADTRGGLTGAAREAFAEIKAHANMHVGASSAAAYVQKVEEALAKAPSAKPSGF